MEQQKQAGIQPGEREHKSEFLTYLITQKSLSPSEANALAADLLTGAVETVGYSQYFVSCSIHCNVSLKMATAFY